VAHNKPVAVDVHQIAHVIVGVGGLKSGFQDLHDRLPAAQVSARGEAVRVENPQ
jgi:hypothetical protein